MTQLIKELTCLGNLFRYLNPFLLRDSFPLAGAQASCLILSIVSICSVLRGNVCWTILPQSTALQAQHLPGSRPQPSPPATPTPQPSLLQLLSMGSSTTGASSGGAMGGAPKTQPLEEQHRAPSFFPDEPHPVLSPPLALLTGNHLGSAQGMIYRHVLSFTVPTCQA